MAKPHSRIDPLSWAIFVDLPNPGDDLLKFWSYPSKYPHLSPLIHETIHFWHSISTTQGIKLAFDCLKSMNAMRFAAKKGLDLRNIGPDWNFEGYYPFSFYKEFLTPGIKKNILSLEGEAERIAPFISTFHIFEGIARYWDLLITKGYTVNGIISELIHQENPNYSAAYAYAYDIIGESSFILFPIFGYLALCSEEPTSCFSFTLNNFKNSGFSIPKGNFQDVWLIAFEETFNWGGVFPQFFAPMSTYKNEHRRYVNWKIKYSDLIPEDFSLTGHPILEDSVQNMMGLARKLRPDLTDYDREVMIFSEFVFPGNPDFRKTLINHFPPPVVTFSDGKSWINPTLNFSDKPDFFAKSMKEFSMLMGAVFGLAKRAEGKSMHHNCPLTDCPHHHLGICGYVHEFPKSYQGCRFFNILNHEFNF